MTPLVNREKHGESQLHFLRITEQIRNHVSYPSLGIIIHQNSATTSTTKHQQQATLNMINHRRIICCWIKSEAPKVAMQGEHRGNTQAQTHLKCRCSQHCASPARFVQKLYCPAIRRNAWTSDAIGEVFELNGGLQVKVTSSRRSQ